MSTRPSRRHAPPSVAGLAEQPAPAARVRVGPGGGPFSEVSRWRWTRRRRCAIIAAMTQPLPDALLALDAEYAEIVSMLDQPAALSRMVATIPAFAGVKMAWVGEPDGDDRIVLGKSANTQFRPANVPVVPLS